MQRLHVLRVVLFLVMVGLGGRLYQLQLTGSEEQRYIGPIELATRDVAVPSRRGEILASDGETLLAESVPIFSIAVFPSSLPPKDTERRSHVLGELVQLVEMTSTVTLSPSTALQQTDLRSDLSEITELGQAASTQLQAPLLNTGALTLTITPEHTMRAIDLTDTYSDVLTFHNPIESLITNSNLYGYQTIVVKEAVSQELALAVRENSMYLPGVVVVQDYRRQYPQSSQVPSLSHVLGYIGDINQCELVVENPASSWLTSLMDVVGHTPTCRRLLPKQIDPGVLARGILPYRHDDRIGKEGLEGSYEVELRGEMGIDRFWVDALEQPMGKSRILQPRDGNNLVLTIDLDFQQDVEAIVQRWIGEGEARRVTSGGYKSEYPPITNGVAVAMDPRDGRVLAMVSLPTYDNNIWIDPTRADELRNILAPQDPEAQEEITRLAPLTNRAIAGQYPAGSSLKQFVGAIALQNGTIGIDTQLYDPGVLVLRESSGTLFELPNSGRRFNDDITVSDALMVSSNVFFASIAGGNDEAINLKPNALEIDGLGVEKLVEGLAWFNFGQLTDIRLSGEIAGLLPTQSWKAYQLREPWTTGDTYNMSIGQGHLAVTPLQLVRATAAIVNDGIMYRPQLVQAVTDSSGNIIAEMTPETVSQLPIESAYLRVMQEGMRRSVTEGINVAARDECSGLSIAGKTGTAEFGPLFQNARGELTSRSHSWFVGFAPYDNPEIMVVVLLEGTGDLGDGSSTLAVPAVTQIMQSYFNVPPPTETPSFCPALPALPS